MDDRDIVIDDNGEEEVVILLEDDAPEAPAPEPEPVRKAAPVYEEAPVFNKKPASDGIVFEEIHGLGDGFQSLDPKEDEYEYEEGTGFFGGKGIMIAGILVALLAVFVGVLILVKNPIGAKDDVDFSTLGNNIAAIGVIGGEDQIQAIANAHGMRLRDVQEAVRDYNYQEADAENGITTVSVTLTTILKDLKIKFVNSKDRLIAKVPFQVEVTGPDGKKKTWTDEDKDGIIYETGLAGGSYSVKLIPLEGYDTMYDFNTANAKSVSVKTQLDYQKVDVKNEIKKESQVDTSKEDTAAHDTTVESSLKDTVAYVASGKITSGGGYKEVDRSNVTDPVTAIIKRNEVSLPAFRAENSYPNDPFPKFGPVNVDNQTSSSGNDSSGNNKAASGNNQSNNNQSSSGNNQSSSGNNSGSQPAGLNVKLSFNTAKVVFLGGDTVTLQATVSGYKSDSSVKWYVTEGQDKVDVNRETGVLSPKAEGTAKIVAVASENQSIGATATIIVLSHPKNDTVTKLKDNSGNQLYVQDGGSYRDAVYADYYTGVKLYTGSPVNYKYTGWWTIDGKRYYYDSNGNKVTGEQVILGAKYTFGADGALTNGSALGIDVSSWNGNINWERVKQAGVQYAIIRCGFRGSSVGGLVEDKTFATNIKNATAAGIKVGIYFFTQAVSEAEAIEEASMCLSMVEGYSLAYPIFIDVESSGGRADSLDKAARTAVCNAFCRTIANGGYKAGVYANKTWLTGYINTNELTGYTIWLAQYASQPSYTSTRYDLWQYSSTGKIDGISGNVDLNLSYLGY